MTSNSTAAPEYYNDLSSIILQSSSSNRNSPANVSQRAQTPSDSKAASPLSRNSPFFPVDHITTTTTISSTADATSTVYSLQGNTLEPLTSTTSAHRRFSSTLSSDDASSSVLKSAANSNTGSMVAIDFSVLARNSPATVGGVKSSVSMSNGLHHHYHQHQHQQQQQQQQQMIYQHYQQQQQHHQQQQQQNHNAHQLSYNPYQPPNSSAQQACATHNGGYSSQYAGTSSLYSTTGTSRSHEEDIYEDLCYVTLR